MKKTTEVLRQEIDSQKEQLLQLEEMKAKYHSNITDEEIDNAKWERLSKKCGL